MNAGGRRQFGVTVARGWLLLAALALAPAQAQPLNDQPTLDGFDDRPLEQPLEHPDWFKHSFLDLRGDLEEAVADGKFGLIVYFGQAHCAYCQALLEVNFRNEDILAYTQRYFDVVPIDIWGTVPVTDTDGVVLGEREFALREGTNFTPSLLFYDAQGRKALRLRGYYPPYRFRAALKYVVEGYYRAETFAEYLLRADPPPKFDVADLNEQAFFADPPHLLDRSRFAAARPLVVFFEQGNCHACDILHSGPLQAEDVQASIGELDAVQVDMWSEVPVLTPDGRRETARRWAQRLGLRYAPALVFFDESGREIVRVDSVVGLYRLRNILQYVVERAYREHPSYLVWRGLQRRGAPP